MVWVKDRKQVRSSKKFKITSKNFDTSLHILNLEASDVGEYHCKASNEVGSDTCVCTVKFQGLYTGHKIIYLFVSSFLALLVIYVAVILFFFL